MYVISDHIKELTNNVTEQYIFSLLDIAGIETTLEDLDLYFSGYLYEGIKGSQKNAEAYYRFTVLRNALITAAKEFDRKQDLLRENEIIKQVTTQKEG